MNGFDRDDAGAGGQKYDAPVMAAVFIFVQAISFNAPFTRVRLKPPPRPFRGGRSHGYCQTNGRGMNGIGRNRPGNDCAGSVTPRLEKNFRSFSSARFTRILAASSLAPRPVRLHPDFVLKKPEHHGVAVFFAQARHRRVEQRRDLGQTLGSGSFKSDCM